MKKFLLLFIIFILQNIELLSQSTDSLSLATGVPVSFSNNIIFSNNFRTAINPLILPAFDNDVLIAQADSIEKNTFGGIHYFGHGNRNFIDIKNNAQYYNSNIENGKLWILKMSSSTALGFKFYFSKFKIPDDAFLYIYTTDSSRILGPFNSSNNPADTLSQIQFQTQLIMGNEVYLEYYEKDSSEFSGVIEIDNAIHIFRHPFDRESPTRDPLDPSAICQEDATCLAGWGPEINSVAKVFKYDIFTIL
jgi:hypothetical protein